MLFRTFVVAFLAIVQFAVALAPPEYRRTLVVLDDSNADVDAGAVTAPLEGRGFEVTVAGVRAHPVLVEYGARTFDNVIVIPGRTKALGSTLKSTNFLEFMKLGGNVIALTTPQYSPLALRELARELGIELGGRGVQVDNAFETDLTFGSPFILEDFKGEWRGAAAAKLSSNPLVLGLAQAPHTAYAWNAAKEEGELSTGGALTEAFALGNEVYIAAALQALNGARFVWVGASDLLTDAQAGAALTSWAFHERGALRFAGAQHYGKTGDSHLHYSVDEPLKYCAQIEHWESDLDAWAPYSAIDDVQLEFRMLDPYYRLNLDKQGCVEFVAPDQYGMFTFLIDYQRPGFTFLESRDIVTVRHRANDEWARSWTITNSWVYLSGVSTTVIGFIAFIALYLALPDSRAVQTDAKTQTRTTASSTGMKEKETTATSTSKPKQKKKVRG